jgi:hypothetical protein
VFCFTPVKKISDSPLVMLNLFFSSSFYPFAMLAGQDGKINKKKNQHYKGRVTKKNFTIVK